MDPAPADAYVVRDNGTDLKGITTSPIDKVVAATWTPDGRSLGVIHPVDGVNQLDLFDAEGFRPPQRIDAAAGADTVAFRPPLGKEIVFRALVDLKYGLFVMNADGSNKRTLVTPTNPVDVDQDLNAVTYSADGSRIFYQRWFPDSIQLWVMNADGTDPHEFVSEPGPGWDGIAEPSPDGKWVAYWHVIEDGRPTQHVSVVRADGTGPIIPIGPALTGTADYLWSPDSTKILMIPTMGAVDRRCCWIRRAARGRPCPGSRISISTGSAPRSITDQCRRPTTPIGQGRTPGGRARGSRYRRLGCGERIRTSDLRVMSPTSCRCSTPRPVTLGPEADSVKPWTWLCRSGEVRR